MPKKLTPLDFANFANQELTKYRTNFLIEASSVDSSNEFDQEIMQLLEMEDFDADICFRLASLFIGLGVYLDAKNRSEDSEDEGPGDGEEDGEEEGEEDGEENDF